MILAITGGRFDANGKPLNPPADQRRRFLYLLTNIRPTVLRHGNAVGTDTYIAAYVDWMQSFLPHSDELYKTLKDLVIIPFPVSPEDGHGKGAPNRRNCRMLDTPPPVQVLVAFPGGSGTAHCVRAAIKRGIEVWQWKGDSEMFERITT